MKSGKPLNLNNNPSYVGTNSKFMKMCPHIIDNSTPRDKKVNEKVQNYLVYFGINPIHSNVFSISIAIVIGPTPPGTGVI